MKFFLFGCLILISSRALAACPGMTVTINTQPTTCSNAQDGQATAMVSGGSGNYSFSFVNSSYSVLPNQSGNQVLGMMAGNYFVIVNDITNGCADTSAYTIVAPNPLTANAIVSHAVECAGTPTGELLVNASGGTTPYVYSWNTGATTQTASNLSAGTYTATVTDANGCTAQATVVLNDTPATTINSTSTPSSCNGSDGTITINVNGPGPFLYSVDGGATFSGMSYQSTNYASGTYYLVVIDIAACYAYDTITVGNASGLIATANSTPSSCNPCNGTLTINQSGGTAPFIYEISGFPQQTSNLFTGVCAGTYVYTVMDANGCISNATTVVAPTNAISVSANSTPTNCGASNGTITANATGGNGSFQYSIDNGNTYQASNVFSGLSSGTYYIDVLDGNGCTESVSVTVGMTSNLVVTAASTPSGCSPCSGSVTILQSGGTAPYLYEISGHPQQTGNVITSVCAGTYVATVTDNTGCIATYNVMVNQNGLTGATVSADSIHHSSGAGINDGFIDISVNGPNAPYSFLWSNGATSEDIFSLTGGAYSVTITDANGNCQSYSFVVSTIQPGGWINGYVYQDDNNNCIYDGSDLPLSNYYIIASDGTTNYFGYTNAQGYYSIWVPIGNYTIQPSNGNNLVGACASSYNLSVNFNSNHGGNNFYYHLPPTNDVCASVYNTGIVPGFNGTYYFYVNNEGNQPASGTACFYLPAALTYLGASPSPISIINDTVCFSFSNVAPGAFVVYAITYNAPSFATLGTSMTACYDATLSSGIDVNPACNTGCYASIVTGSYDPNDKSVSPMGENGDGNIYVNEYEFTYLIRFQNTGTGPAVNVLVTDTLSALLDITSLEVLNASHDYVVEMINNTLRFRFNNIMLPDSNSNEPASHGHIQFRLSTLNAPAVGQEIENTANIYFDFNEPVITNTTHNEYVSPVSVEEESTNGLLLYPNPTNQAVYLQSASNLATQVELMDLSGRIIHSGSFSKGTMTIPCDKLAEGVYFIHTTTNGTTKTIKLIVQH